MGTFTEEMNRLNTARDAKDRAAHTVAVAAQTDSEKADQDLHDHLATLTGKQVVVTGWSHRAEFRIEDGYEWDPCHESFTAETGTVTGAHPGRQHRVNCSDIWIKFPDRGHYSFCLIGLQIEPVEPAS